MSDRRALMVCGTTSDAGKTTIVAGLCRILARAGVRVAPFKAQNMALNSAVTVTGHEIGRAQYLQAQAAGVTPDVAMNPILLKPTSHRSSQLVVMGRAVGEMSAVEYHEAKPELFAVVLDALADLRARYDVVLIEGAGSPAEINLLANDIVNLNLARAARVPAVLVGNIDLGGVFASLYGTVNILPPELRSLIAGFIINKLRGDPTMLLDGIDQLTELTGLPTFGVVPMLDDLRLDAEDSLALNVAPEYSATASLDVAVVRLPHISNFTDLDPLMGEPDVAVRYVRSGRELGRPDLIIIPGSKATTADLAWLQARHLDVAIQAVVTAGRSTVLGVCGGYQMLGRRIVDHVEGVEGEVDGLALLPVTTTFHQEKVLTRCSGRALGATVEGYQIHHGQVVADQVTAELRVERWLQLDHGGADTARPDGVRVGPVFGTTLHGLFDADDFRRRFLTEVAKRAATSYSPGGLSPAARRDQELDRLADHLELSLDIEAIRALVDQSGRQPVGPGARVR